MNSRSVPLEYLYNPKTVRTGDMFTRKSSKLDKLRIKSFRLQNWKKFIYFRSLFSKVTTRTKIGLQIFTYSSHSSFQLVFKSSKVFKPLK